MKILHLCPLWFPVEKDAAGGKETFLSQLILELEKLGCHNTIMASGDSRGAGTLVPVTEWNLKEQMETGAALEYAYHEQHQLWLAVERAAEFDVIHSHVGSGAYVLSAVPGLRGKVLHTIHTPIYVDHMRFVRQHPDVWFSTVSEFQARKLWEQGAVRCRVIPNGIDVEQFTFQRRGSEELLFIGRMERWKGPDLALQVARKLGRPIALAGPIVEKEFFDRTIRPFLNSEIRYVGVVDHRQKNELLGRAACAVLPFRGEEGFGLVAIEAMACGTPVVSLANGALPEIIEPGLTGYLAQDEELLVALVEQATRLDRSAIRARVAERFRMSAVAERYHSLYLDIVKEARLCESLLIRASSRMMKG